MYLAPVIFFSLWGKREVAAWSYLTAFVLALGGAALYCLEAGGSLSLLEPWTGIAHKYDKLMLICLVVLIGGCGAFLLGLKPKKETPAA